MHFHSLLSDSIIHVSCHFVFVSFLFPISLQVSDHGVLVIVLDSGLNFPSAEYLSDTLYRQALLGETTLQNLNLNLNVKAI